MPTLSQRLLNKKNKKRSLIDQCLRCRKRLSRYIRFRTSLHLQVTMAMAMAKKSLTMRFMLNYVDRGAEATDTDSLSPVP